MDKLKCEECGCDLDGQDDEFCDSCIESQELDNEEGSDDDD